MNASPTKRRALASLDVNAPSPNTQHRLAKHAAASPAEPDCKKRLLLPMASSEQPPSKKACLAPTTSPELESTESASSGRDAGAVSEEQEHQHQQGRGGSASPAPSSVFDSSGIDTSQATHMTEPDMDATTATTAGALPAPRPRRVPTREESRQKAEILKLRLSLAKYKLRTGQTDVPLEQLQIRPLPGTALKRRRTPLPSGPVRPPSSSGSATAAAPSLRRQDSYGSVASSASASAPSIEADDDEPSERETDARKQQPRRSPEKEAPSLLTPRRGHLDDEASDRLTSSALRGGAASSLLRLSAART